MRKSRKCCDGLKTSRRRGCLDQVQVSLQRSVAKLKQKRLRPNCPANGAAQWPPVWISIHSLLSHHKFCIVERNSTFGGLKVSVGESPSWLRHRILIPACKGSNPFSPAKNSRGSPRPPA